MQTSSNSERPPVSEDMGEQNEHAHNRPGGRKLVVALVAVPLIGIVSILVWGVAQTGGTAGRPGVNSSFGEVEFEQRQASDFEITLFDDGAPGDQTLKLSDLRGKLVMVDFWSSWCPPCRAEAPTLAEVYRSYEGQPVEFVGIDVWDTEKGASDYLSRYGVTFPAGEDPQGKIAVEYGLRGIPEKYFVDADGVIRQKFIGPMKRETLVALIDGYLKEMELKQLREITPGG